MTLGAPQQSSRTNRCNGFRSVWRGTLPSDHNPPVIIPPLRPAVASVSSFPVRPAVASASSFPVRPAVASVSSFPVRPAVASVSSFPVRPAVASVSSFPVRPAVASVSSFPIRPAVASASSFPHPSRHSREGGNPAASVRSVFIRVPTPRQNQKEPRNGRN